MPPDTYRIQYLPGETGLPGRAVLNGDDCWKTSIAAAGAGSDVDGARAALQDLPALTTPYDVCRPEGRLGRAAATVELDWNSSVVTSGSSPVTPTPSG